MKSRKIIFALVLALRALSTGTAFADDKPTTGHPIKGVTWQELQGRCADPNNWPDLQGVIPSNVQIECGNIERGWVPTEPGSVPLSGDRQVAAAVSATKFSVSSAIVSLAVPTTSGACPKFKEVVRTSHIVVPVDCGQVIGWKGSPVDFCQHIFDSGKGTGPKETVTQDTGRTIDTCALTPGTPTKPEE
jgi:hypothetical protein